MVYCHLPLAIYLRIEGVGKWELMTGSASTDEAFVLVIMYPYSNSCASHVSGCCCCCRPHSTNVLPAESSTLNHVAASSLSPQVARKGSTLSGFVQRSRLEREVGRDLHSNKWEEV